MKTKLEKNYCFKARNADLEQIYMDISNLLGMMPTSIYDELLICIHELIINSIVEMEEVKKKTDLIRIDIYLTDKKAILCLKDHGRGISKSDLGNCDQDILKEKGRGLEIIMMLSDWFCIYFDDNCYSYYLIKEYID